MRTLRRLFAVAILLAAAALVTAVFVFIYNALSPKSSSGGLLVSDAFPTPLSLEDVPLGMYLQQHLAELNAPASSDPTPVSFRVAPGELPTDVAARLQTQGLIKNADLFVNLVKYLHVGPKIQAGEYVLKRTMTMDDIIDALQHGRAKTITLTIRPGMRAEEIADYLATLGLASFDKDQVLQLVKNGQFDYTFMRDRPKGAPTSIEGFLFPETYNVPFDITTAALINLILDTFNQRVTDKMRQEAASSKLTFYEAVTLASIVEREAVAANERSIIASVFLNRLKKKMYLQADSTAQYSLGYQPTAKQWWKSPMTIDELTQADTPYNTYLHAGLPIGPICSPSLASIIAALEPAQTDYLYFFAKGDGTHAFAKTYEEHQQNQQKYSGK
ncbi:MAG: endolytic transglycosylase MltG [Chloroflexota bacterium]|nr:endolytic transglycosylase MltG [Chloroflexota bacterium]